MKFEHTSVLLEETIDGLNIKPDGIYVDGTVGAGGHSKEILKRLTSGKLICIDQDDEALNAAKENLKEYLGKVKFIKKNFSQVGEVLEELNIEKIDGMILDLGVSSHQIDTAVRGFSYMKDGKLDMRMDKEKSLSAKKIINEYTQRDLERIFWNYGEEKMAKKIAANIIKRRNEKPIESTLELSEIVENSIPQKFKKGRGHPSKKIFQALRIEVNKELEVINEVIPKIVEKLKPKGRLCIITFHSLEDRIVKNKYKELSQGCICPKNFPLCVCKHKEKIKIINSKPICPSNDEILKNKRSKSAKLRIAERISNI